MLAWLKAHGREDLPRYLLGQSYGSVRVIKIAIDLAKIRPVDAIIVELPQSTAAPWASSVSRVPAAPSVAFRAITSMGEITHTNESYVTI